jgi:hypothetical protein
MRIRKRAVVYLFIVVAAVSSARAQPSYEWKDGLDRKASTHSEVTTLDLIRKIFPDARVKAKDAGQAETGSSPSLRHLYGDKMDENIFGGASDLYVIDKRETLDAKDRIVWLLISASEASRPNCNHCVREILAAFRISKNDAALIDAANIQMYDRSEFDSTRPVLRIAQKRNAVVVWNISQLSISPETFSVIAAGKTKFQVLLGQFDTFREFMCGGGYGEESDIRALKTSRRGYHDLQITITTEQMEERNNGAETVVTFRRRFRYVFGWDPLREKYKPIVYPDRERKRLLKKLVPCGRKSIVS